MIKPILVDRFYVVGFFEGRRYPEELRCPINEIDDYKATHNAYILGKVKVLRKRGQTRRKTLSKRIGTED